MQVFDHCFHSSLPGLQPVTHLYSGYIAPEW